MPSTPRAKLPVTNNLTQIESIPLKTANGHSFLLHLFPQDKTKVNQLNLVAISPQEPYQNIDILATSLRESLLHNAANSDLECIESLKSNASMHTMHVQTACMQSVHICKHSFFSARVPKGRYGTSHTSVYEGPRIPCNMGPRRKALIQELMNLQMRDKCGTCKVHLARTKLATEAQLCVQPRTE